MRIVVQTFRDRVKSLPERWSGRFSHLPSWTDTTISREGSHQMTYERIKRLDLETCSLEDLRNIASYLPGWVMVRCEGCQREQGVVDVVIFEEEPDYDVDDYTVVMCGGCLASGLAA